jgi:hypothetical protein
MDDVEPPWHDPDVPSICISSLLAAPSPLDQQAIMKSFHVLFLGGLLWANVAAYVPSKKASNPPAFKVAIAMLLPGSSFLPVVSLLPTNRSNAQNGKAIL